MCSKPLYQLKNPTSTPPPSPFKYVFKLQYTVTTDRDLQRFSKLMVFCPGDMENMKTERKLVGESLSFKTNGLQQFFK
jgi:hypothetical protein